MSTKDKLGTQPSYSMPFHSSHFGIQYWLGISFEKINEKHASTPGWGPRQ